MLFFAESKKVHSVEPVCPIMVFGDLDDPNEINKHIARKGIFQLKPDQKTKPKLYYRADSTR
jgi:Fe-S-cluster-containing dehydrogenase component